MRGVGRVPAALLPASRAQWCGRPHSAYTGKTAGFAVAQRSLRGRASWARGNARTPGLGRRSEGPATWRILTAPFSAKPALPHRRSDRATTAKWDAWLFKWKFDGD